MVNLLKELLEDEIYYGIEWLQYLSKDIGIMKKMREEFRDDSELELLISDIVWQEWNSIPELKRKIESARRRIKEFG